MRGSDVVILVVTYYHIIISKIIVIVVPEQLGGKTSLVVGQVRDAWD